MKETMSIVWLLVRCWRGRTDSFDGAAVIVGALGLPWLRVVGYRRVLRAMAWGFGEWPEWPPKAVGEHSVPKKRKI